MSPALRRRPPVEVPDSPERSMNGANFQIDNSYLPAAPHNFAIRLCFNPLAFPRHLVALRVRIFDQCLLALSLVLALDRSFLFPDHFIQVPNGIPSAKVSQKNGLDAAPLAFVFVIHVVEEKKILALLIRQVKGAYTSSLLAFSRFVDDVCRL